MAPVSLFLSKPVLAPSADVFGCLDLTAVLSHQTGELTGYCTSSNRHQKGWAKRNVDYCPRSVCAVDRRPVVQRIMETDPLQQGQALAFALKNKKKMQKRTGGVTRQHLCAPKRAHLGP